MNMKKVLAFDFGASSGRAMLGTYADSKIKIDEIHRFENIPVEKEGTLYWDLEAILKEIKTALKKAGDIDSIAFDTWGVDFGLIGEDGKLLENPVHYRDARTNGIFGYAFGRMPKDRLYERTGNQIMEINTLFQLASLIRDGSEKLNRAKCLLMMPDLFNYLLSGVKSTEISIASTTQMMDTVQRRWSDEILESFGIPRILTDIHETGTVVGTLSDEICSELGIGKAKIISVASHDTQSAIASVPACEKDFIYVSCGTWSLFGTEIARPIINEKSAAYNLTNEIGTENTYDFMKNIIGLWLIQESRRQWKREGRDYSYAELEKLALDCAPLKCFIDPDAPEFVAPGDIPGRVREFCRRTGQYVPQSVGEVMRCIYESIAMKYHAAYDEIKDCTGKAYDAIHIVGGGTKDGLLCQMTANSCGCIVYAGPVEATVLGNVAVQLIALGEIDSVTEARRIISGSEKILEFTPIGHQIWNEKYSIFKNIIKTEVR